jgi:ElaB/YqjD/DUF883 family membrane-anchored ribosome-binding protein
MDAEAGLEETAAELRSQISHTQEDLGDKIETLENEVRAVARNIGDTIRKSIDIRERVKERPFLSCLVATGVGVLVGRRVMRRREERFDEFGAIPSMPGRGLAQMLAPEIGALRALLVSKGISIISRILQVEPRQDEASPEQRVH